MLHRNEVFLLDFLIAKNRFPCRHCLSRLLNDVPPPQCQQKLPLQCTKRLKFMQIFGDSLRAKKLIHGKASAIFINGSIIRKERHWGSPWAENFNLTQWREIWRCHSLSHSKIPIRNGVEPLSYEILLRIGEWNTINEKLLKNVSWCKYLMMHILFHYFF